MGEASGLFIDDDSRTYHQIQLVVVNLPEAAAAIAEANTVLGAAPTPPQVSPGLAFGRVNFALDRIERQATDALSIVREPASHHRLAEALARFRADKDTHKQVARSWFRADSGQANFTSGQIHAGHRRARQLFPDGLLLAPARSRWRRTRR